MSTKLISNIVYVTTNEVMRTLMLECLSDSPEIVYIDTEFTRKNTYFPCVELIQLMWKNEKRIVIDIKCVTHFEELINLLDNEKIMKVFHSARQDIEGLWGLLNMLPQNVFDTQIAASFLGFGQSIGLNDLLHSTLQLDMNKDEQYSDWSLRPLRESQIQYAAQDVYYVSLVHNALINELRANEREGWVLSYFSEIDWYQKLIPSPTLTWTRLKNQISSENSLFFLTYYAPLREQLAQEHNLNRARVLTDKNLILLCEILVQMAHKKQITLTLNDIDFPDSYDAELFKPFLYLSTKLLEGYHARSKKKYKQLYKTADQLLFNQKQHALFIQMKNIINAQAQRLAIPANILVSSTLLEDFVLNPTLDHLLLTGWRSSILLSPVKKILDNNE